MYDVIRMEPGHNMRGAVTHSSGNSLVYLIIYELTQIFIGFNLFDFSCKMNTIGFLFW